MKNTFFVDFFLLIKFWIFKDYEHLGRAFCETLMDYYDENPIKVKKFNNAVKICKRKRRKEKKLKKAAKIAKKLAEEERIALLDKQLENFWSN